MKVKELKHYNSGFFGKYTSPYIRVETQGVWYALACPDCGGRITSRVNWYSVKYHDAELKVICQSEHVNYEKDCDLVRRVS